MENTKILTVNDVIEIIRDLSYSQGFYGRLYRAIIELKNDNPAGYNDFCELINNKRFTNAVDVVMYFEC